MNWHSRTEHGHSGEKQHIRASRTIALCKQCPQAFANTLIAALPVFDYDEYRK
jgi:hypothetical protein